MESRLKEIAVDYTESCLEAGVAPDTFALAEELENEATGAEQREPDEWLALAQDLIDNICDEWLAGQSVA